LHVHGLATNRLPRGLGEIAPAATGFNLMQPGEQEETVLAADIAFLPADRVPPRATDTFARLAPDLVAEIASGGSTPQAWMPRRACG
jgi:hypothetical protein